MEDRAGEPAYSPSELESWIREQNAAVMVQLVASLRSKTGVIPFIGAGTSGPFGYPLWGAFLEGCAASEEDRAAVTALLGAGEFEQAAQALVDRDKAGFYDRVRAVFTRRPDLAAAGDSPLTRLPMLAPGPVITTNFDPVLECIYEADGRPFTAEHLVYGRNDPMRVVTALQEDRSALIKLHGDAGDPDSLTFTAVEYVKSYGDDNRAGPVAQLATVLYTNRPLLFLGCSLETDRTLRSLKKVHAENPFLSHYAVLAAVHQSDKLHERAKDLADAGIRPLWFYPNAFGQITELLDELVRRTATDELCAPGPAPLRSVPSEPSVPLPRVEGIAWPAAADEQTKAAVEALLSGQLAFFLGAGVHPNRMFGQEFYQEVCRRTGVPWPSRDRADVAQHVAEAVGRERLSAVVEEIIRDYYTRPSEVHSLLASLPRTLRQRGQTREPLMILTTNYDTVLEAVFEAEGEPYHLFLYNHDGAHAGCFLHRTPEGGESVIRRPSAVREMAGDASIIVKLNGGVDPQGRWPGSFVVASRDFAELSTRQPGVIPRALWDRLKRRSLLFWGHGLREEDVRVLTRSHKLVRSVPRSWAVQLGATDARYWWEVAGVEIIEADLGSYLQRFSACLPGGTERVF